MSKFSGKCDFGDDVLMFSSPEKILECQVYHNNHLLKFENADDLIPLYPYLTSQANGKSFYLSDKSYVDTEETEWVTLIIAEVISLYKKSKRLKEEFNIDFCNKYKTSLSFDKPLWNAIIQRIKGTPVITKYPTSEPILLRCVRDAYFADIHTSRATSYREMLLDFAADTSFGPIYKLRGDDYYNAIYKYKNSIASVDNLIDCYFGEYDKSKPVATEIDTMRYRFNPLLHDIVHKVMEYNKMKRDFGGQ